MLLRFKIRELKKANQIMGALKFFLSSENVDIRAKYLIYMAIPLNLRGLQQKSL